MASVVVYFVVLVALTPLVGTWMYRVFTRERIGRVEGAIYRLCRIRPNVEQTWRRYAVSMLWFSAAGFAVMFVLMRLQGRLPMNPAKLDAVDPYVAFNVAASFLTNTDWQPYTGETTMSYLTDMAALTFQNFTSAAVGMAVLVAFARGFARSGTDKLGNFWRDLIRGTIYILLPLSFAVALVLVSQGVVQTLAGPAEVTGLHGSTQTISRGPAASQIAIKQIGTNGGGFFGVNSAHPFENPTPFTNFFECLLILLLPAGITYTFGRIVGRRSQGWALVATMLVLLAGGIGATLPGERHATPAMEAAGMDHAAPNLEGKEVRFGTDSSSLWSGPATASSNGAVNSMLASYQPIAGAVFVLNMNMGVFGAVGGGVYAIVFFVIIAALMGGLMVGRTPEYLGKRMHAREIKLAMIGVLVSFVLTLGLSAIALVVPAGLEARLNTGPHGFTEILYAFTSQANNNGSAFAGLDGSGPFYAVLGGVAMLMSRFAPMVAALALAGGVARAGTVTETSGTLRTDTPLFVGFLVGVIIIISAPLPALTLGPIVEQLGGALP